MTKTDETTDFKSSDIEGQTDQVLKNIGAILEASGSSYDKVVKTTVLLADMGDFPKMNSIYSKCKLFLGDFTSTDPVFPSNPPARATFAVKTLPKNALVEIEAVALADR